MVAFSVYQGLQLVECLFKPNVGVVITEKAANWRQERILLLSMVTCTIHAVLAVIRAKILLIINISAIVLATGNGALPRPCYSNHQLLCRILGWGRSRRFCSKDSSLFKHRTYCWPLILTASPWSGGTQMAKKLLGEPWGQAKAMSPAIRLLNYSGDVVITTSFYAEYWLGAGAEGFILKTPNYSNTNLLLTFYSSELANYTSTSFSQ